jgi:hypothetical protein
MTVRQVTLWLGFFGMLCSVPPTSAAPFVLPSEGITVFRRDRLPLDTDTMRELADQLGRLAAGQGGSTAADRRAVSQLIALTLALQPDHREIRQFAEKFGSSEQQPSGDLKRLVRDRARVWEILAWLETPDTGTDSHALANCLSDVMVVVDSKHPRAIELLKASERGNWRDWVRPLSDFELSDPDDDAAKPSTDPDSEPPTGPATIQLAEAEVSTVLLTTGDKAAGGTAMRLVPVAMEAHLKKLPTETKPPSTDPKHPATDVKPPEKVPTFSCTWSGVSSTNDTETLRQLGYRVKEVIETGRSPFPTGYSMTLRSGNRLTYVIDQDRSGVSGAMAVLLSASVSGVVPNATVVGEIDKEGKFVLPPRFWERLRALSNGPGGRLVLPPEAATYLPSILALEEPGFFIKYEVLLASNLEELLARTAKNHPPETADVSARFAEITGKLGSQAVPEYVANRFVRQRLDELGRAAPFHASARMLAIQGAAKRPTTLPRAILATEFLSAIRPMDWIPKEMADKLDATTLNSTLEASKTAVARMERYCEVRDRDLLDLTNDLVVSLRTLSRAIRKSGSSDNSSSQYREFEAFKRSHGKATEMLKLQIKPLGSQ